MGWLVRYMQDKESEWTMLTLQFFSADEWFKYELPSKLIGSVVALHASSAILPYVANHCNI